MCIRDRVNIAGAIRLGKELGPTNLIPKPKNATVTMDVVAAEKAAKSREVK